MERFLFSVFVTLALAVTFCQPAEAYRSVWFHDTTGGGADHTYATYVNVINTHATNTITATITFHAGTTLAGGTLLGSTTRVMVPGAYWNFGTNAPIDTTSLTTNTLNANTRGTVQLKDSGAAGDAKGWVSILNSTTNAGFEFTFQGAAE